MRKGAKKWQRFSGAFKFNIWLFYELSPTLTLKLCTLWFFNKKDRYDAEGCLAETSFHQVHWGGIEYPPWELAQRALRRIEVPSFAFGATSAVGAGGSMVLVSFVRLSLEKNVPVNARSWKKSFKGGLIHLHVIFFLPSVVWFFEGELSSSIFIQNMPVVWMICIIIMYPYHPYVHDTGNLHTYDTYPSSAQPSWGTKVSERIS